MVVRKRRKKNRLRGNRTHGAGNTKNRRGSGFRGGVGKAGSHKHKYSKYYADFGVKKMFKARAKKPIVNLGFVSERLGEWIGAGKAVRDGDIIVVDAKKIGFGKVLGMGSIREKIRVENAKVSEGAAKKIVAAGGEAGAGSGDEFGAAETQGEEALETGGSRGTGENAGTRQGRETDEEAETSRMGSGKGGKDN